MFDDLQAKELRGKFQPKREKALLLAASYKRIGFTAKSEHVSQCGTFLEFAYELRDSGICADSGKLHNANFCRDRLCPLCSWRRSMKIFGQASQIMDQIRDQFDFLFITLTVQNVYGSELQKTIDRLLQSWHKLVNYKRIKAVNMGCFRALEITRNSDLFSPWFGSFHPHLHIIMAVPRSYWHHGYIKHADLLAMWQRAYKDPHISQIKIESAMDRKDKLYKSRTIAEIAKYAVKESDYIFPEDPATTDDILKILVPVLRGRRLVAYSGCFKSTFHVLQLDDPEEGDLVHVRDKLNPEVAYLIARFHWAAGCYKLDTTFIQAAITEESDLLV